MKLKTIALLTTGLFSLHCFAEPMIGTQPTAPTPTINLVPIGTILPMLDMQFNCGECEQNTKIKALVEGSYLDQAALERAQIDEHIKSTLTVTHYRSRGKARFFIGALAGADNITGSIDCNGATIKVSDSAMSAVNGIESVARNVGHDAYKAIRDCYLSKNNTPEIRPHNDLIPEQHLTPNQNQFNAIDISGSGN